MTLSCWCAQSGLAHAWWEGGLRFRAWRRLDMPCTGEAQMWSADVCGCLSDWRVVLLSVAALRRSS